jgi:hypothetical protein
MKLAFSLYLANKPIGLFSSIMFPFLIKPTVFACLKQKNKIQSEDYNSVYLASSI